MVTRYYYSNIFALRTPGPHLFLWSGHLSFTQTAGSISIGMNRGCSTSSWKKQREAGRVIKRTLCAVLSRPHGKDFREAGTGMYKTFSAERGVSIKYNSEESIIYISISPSKNASYLAVSKSGML